MNFIVIELPDLKEMHLIPSHDDLEHKPDKKCICDPCRDNSIEGLEEEEDQGMLIFLHNDKYMRVYN